MRHAVSSFAIASSLIVSPLVPSQADAQSAVASPAGAAVHEARQQALPRYIVRFKQRSFDLEKLRVLVRAARHKTAGPLEQADVERELSALVTRALAERKDFIRFVEAENGKVEEVFWLVNAALVRADANAKAEILRHPDVEGIDLDVSRGPMFIKTSTNAKNHRADAMHAASVMGKGVSVAIVDSGLDMHMGTSGRAHSTFFVAGDPKNKTGGGIGGSRVLANYKVGFLPAEDTISHGTPVAAIAAGEKWNKGSASDRGHAPSSHIVGYGVADLPNGYANIYTLVRAWQQVARDAIKHNIRVANFSYFGAPDPRAVDEQAMDQAARVADILITVSGGNDAIVMTQAHGATNVLSVGSVTHDTHWLSKSSTRGTLTLGGKRRYPSVVANGENMIVPRIDIESADARASGSSYAAPAVAGAAALYRSLRISATALETRAALLASIEDIRGQNAGSIGVGHGYLRDDLLVAIAQGKGGGIIANGSLTEKVRLARLSFAAQKGRYYAVSLCWDRHDTPKLAWSNLDLEVRIGKQVIASSKTLSEVSERLVLSVPSTTQVDVVVIGTGLEGPVVPYALVIADSTKPYVVPHVITFGKSCKITATLTPILVGYGNSAVGGRYDLIGAVLGPKQLVALTFGFSNTKFGTIALPFDLTKLGAPGCTLYTSIEHVAPRVTSSAGILQYGVVIPPVRGLIGAHVYHQLLIPYASSNAFGMAFSEAVEVRIGG